MKTSYSWTFTQIAKFREIAISRINSDSISFKFIGTSPALTLQLFKSRFIFISYAAQTVILSVKFLARILNLEITVLPGLICTALKINSFYYEGVTLFYRTFLPQTAGSNRDPDIHRSPSNDSYRRLIFADELEHAGSLMRSVPFVSREP